MDIEQATACIYELQENIKVIYVLEAEIKDLQKQIDFLKDVLQRRFGEF